MELSPKQLGLEALYRAGRVASWVVYELSGGGWSELPPLPQGEIHRPVRANIQYLRTPDAPGIPDNIELGEE